MIVRRLIARKEVWRRCATAASSGWLEQLYVDPAHHNEGAHNEEKPPDARYAWPFRNGTSAAK